MFRRIGMEDEPHQAKGQNVKDRADRSKEDHKAAQFAGIPALRLFDLLFVDVIKRNRHLGYIVQQVLNQ